MKKVCSELIIYTNNSVIQELLMQLLNDANEDVQKIQESLNAVVIQKKIAEETTVDVAEIIDISDHQKLVQTVSEKLNLYMNIKNLTL